MARSDSASRSRRPGAPLFWEHRPTTQEAFWGRARSSCSLARVRAGPSRGSSWLGVRRLSQTSGTAWRRHPTATRWSPAPRSTHQPAFKERRLCSRARAQPGREARCSLRPRVARCQSRRRERPSSVRAWRCRRTATRCWPAARRTEPADPAAQLGHSSARAPAGPRSQSFLPPRAPRRAVTSVAAWPCPRMGGRR